MIPQLLCVSVCLVLVCVDGQAEREAAMVRYSICRDSRQEESRE